MYKKKSTQAAGLEPNAPKQLQCLNNNSEISGATLTVVSQIQKLKLKAYMRLHQVGNKTYVD